MVSGYRSSGTPSVPACIVCHDRWSFSILDSRNTYIVCILGVLLRLRCENRQYLHSIVLASSACCVYLENVSAGIPLLVALLWRQEHSLWLAVITYLHVTHV